jgi:hypothetical protein
LQIVEAVVHMFWVLCYPDRIQRANPITSYNNDGCDFFLFFGGWGGVLFDGYAQLYPASWGIKAALGNLRISDDGVDDAHQPYQYICDMRDPQGTSFIEVFFSPQHEMN